MSILEIFEFFANLITEYKYTSAIQIGCYSGIFISLLKEKEVSLYATNSNPEFIDKVKEEIPQTVFYSKKEELFEKTDFKDSFILFTEPWASFKENVEFIKNINAHTYYVFILPFGALETDLPFNTEKQVKRFLKMNFGLKNKNNKYFTNIIEYSNEISYLVIQGEKHESIRKARN